MSIGVFSVDALCSPVDLIHASMCALGRLPRRRYVTLTDAAAAAVVSFYNCCDSHPVTAGQQLPQALSIGLAAPTNNTVPR